MTSKKHRFTWILLVGLLALSACNLNSAATPTEINIDAVYTAAAQTVVAHLTGTAAAQPPAAATPTVTATGTVTPTQAPALTQPATATRVPASGNSGAVGCNNAAYIADVTIPDNQQIAPGQAFTKTWRVQNTGSCAWNTSYKLTFVSGDVMGGAATAITQAVNVNGTADVSVNLAVAPATAAAFDPDASPDAAALLTAQGFDPQAYHGRVAANAVKVADSDVACFAATDFPASCTWLDSQAHIEDTLGVVNIVATNVTACSPLVFYAGKAISGR